MPLQLRSAAVFSLTSALLLALLAPACSQQGEGERCDALKGGDSDCESGLECVESRKLLEDITDRCCNPDGSYSDSRCAPNTGVGNTAGSGGSGAASDAGAGGQAAAGEGPVDVGGGSSGGAPPDATAGQGGQPSAGGMPAMSEAGSPSGGMISTPSAGQGGAD